MRISDWSSDVCSSDLKAAGYPDIGIGMGKTLGRPRRSKDDTIGFRPLEPLLFDRGCRTGFRPGVVTGLEMIRGPRNLPCQRHGPGPPAVYGGQRRPAPIGSASVRERGCPAVEIL